MSPVHASPNVDWGYDVADYLGVHPDYGTLDDLDALIVGAPELGLDDGGRSARRQDVRPQPDRRNGRARRTDTRPMAGRDPAELTRKVDQVKDFKAFLLRGNLVDMAVGVVIGVAFAAVITALVTDLVTPLIAAIGGKPDFSTLTFTINGSHFLYGSFINALISFVVIAAVVFYLVLKPVNVLMAARATEPEGAPTTRACPECLSEIPLAARRCAFCTAEVS